MKKVKFTELSNITCDCGQKIKQNLINRKPDSEQCYKCFSKNKTMATAKQVKNGQKIGRKGGKYNPSF